MNRSLALLIAFIGGAIVAYSMVLALVGALFGFLWIFVFGDDPWPEWTESVLGPLIVIAGLVMWAVMGRMIWKRFQGELDA